MRLFCKSLAFEHAITEGRQREARGGGLVRKRIAEAVTYVHRTWCTSG